MILSKEKRETGKPIYFNFIFTHNSRRSQFAQILARTASAFYGIKASCYSGGVEVTALNERVVASIKRSGFRVVKKGKDNPKYLIFYSEQANPITTFSKLFNDTANVQSGFYAIMTCLQADENCPFIPGAEVRISIPYEDPKVFDGTPEEESMYDGTSQQIAFEMFYVFSQIKTNGFLNEN